MFLSAAELERLTGKKRFSAQRRVLDSLGVPYTTAATGEPLVAEATQFNFNEYSAVRIMNAEGGNGYVFFVNMDNRFLINELHKTKHDDGSLVKHWFKYGVVLSALGILKELQRVEQEAESEPDDEPAATDLERVGQFCGGLARVVVPMIRALHKGPAMLQAAATLAA